MAKTRNASNQTGFIMIAASLLAIVLLMLVLFRYLQNERTVQVRSQVTTLMRTMSGVAYDSLVPNDSSPGILRPVFLSQNQESIAYATVSRVDGSSVVEVATPGLTIPAMAPNPNRDSWLTERETRDLQGKRYVEFFAPLYKSNKVIAYLRMAYKPPPFGLSAKQIPFVATMALVVFALTPLFYVLLRREVRPLQKVSQEISKAMDSGALSSVQLSPNSELSGFMDKFSSFMQLTQDRILELEGQQQKLQNSKKLISYSKARVDNVLESIPEAILILDQTGKISFANRRVETLLNTTHERVMTLPASQWCDDPELLNLLSPTTHHGSAAFLEDTVHLQTSPDSGRSLAAKSYPLFSPSDNTQIHGTMIVLRDVTKQSLARRSQAEFVSHVSHELKTPLNTLALYSEMLQSEQASDATVRIEAANVIHDEVERLATLISNLLTITRIEQGDMTIDRQRVRLTELLTDTVDHIRRSDKAQQLRISTDLPAEIAGFSADKDLLRIAVNNLLTNAVKYTDPGDEVVLRVVDEGNAVRIDVVDTGIGIKSDDLAKVSQRFYRAEDDDVRQRAGHGLGLALVTDIVHLHGGSMQINSELGTGSTFSLVIPKETAILSRAV